jgi:hypothetical protein
MPSDPERLTLACAVLTKNRSGSWDSAWDTRGTVSKKLSQDPKHAETANIEENQSDEPTVPMSQALGRGTVGQQQNPGAAPGTVVGQQDVQPAHHYARLLGSKLT